MAYIQRIGDKWEGPFPNKAREFCGNCSRDKLKILGDGTIIEELELDDLSGCEVWKRVDNNRVGSPSECEAGTSKEMEEKGLVGIYLIQDAIPDADELDLLLVELGDTSEKIDVDTDQLIEEVVSGQRLPKKPFRMEDWL